MKKHPFILLLALAVSLTGQLFGQERPNILWLTIEDTSAYEIGCYGNQQVDTPTIDDLASRGIRYTKASSNAPQCSPARSTIISGSYSKTYGTEHHRHSYKVPQELYYFPTLLRESGYYCTNNSKTDYNSPKQQWKDVWNESSKKATYNSPDRKSDQPFFAVFNTNATHMGRVRSFHTEGRRNFAKEGLDPERLSLPGHVPNLPAIRSDYAFHLEGVQDIDRWVGRFLDDLELRGLSEDTIVFFFSDHGGCLPRGKGFLYQSGLHVPFIVYIPQKWQESLGVEPGTTNDRLISFVDLAPTLLSIAGIEAPEHMQGNAFLGDQTTEAPRYQFGFRGNQETHYDPMRSVSNGRYKLIQNYIRNKPRALRNFYQWGMPANQAWDQAYFSGNLADPSFSKPFAAKPMIELYDLQSDPSELKNLAADPRVAAQLSELTKALDAHIRETKDLGFFPFSQRKKEDSLYRWVRNNGYEFDKLYDILNLVTAARPENQDSLLASLADRDPVIRYWAAIGLGNITGDPLPEKALLELQTAESDEDPYVSAAAAAAIAYRNASPAAIEKLIEQFSKGSEEAYSHLESLSLIRTFTPILKEQSDALRDIAESGKRSSQQLARSILINLGELDYSELYPEKAYFDGMKVNKTRRET